MCDTSDSSVDGATPRTCGIITLQGLPCKRAASLGNAHCFQHAVSCGIVADVACLCRCLDDLHSRRLPSIIDASGDKDNIVATESHPVQCGRMEVLMRNGLERLGLLSGDTMYCVPGRTLIVQIQPTLEISMPVPMCAKLIFSPNNTPMVCPEIRAQRMMAAEGCAPPVLFSSRASNESKGCCWILVQELLTPIDRIRFTETGRSGLTRLQFQDKINEFIRKFIKASAKTGVYHTDIRRDCLMVNSRGEFTVIDWGETSEMEYSAQTYVDYYKSLGFSEEGDSSYEEMKTRDEEDRRFRLQVA